MNLALAGLSYGITLVALVLLAVRTKALIGIYKKGQPDSTRSNDKLQRLRMAGTEIFGHTKMLNFTVVGFAHWFVMIGFFCTLWHISYRIRTVDQPNLCASNHWAPVGL
jgi:hypothetical protein